MKNIRISTAFWTLLVLFLAISCQKVSIDHTSPCTYQATNQHPNAQKYQAVIDKYVAKGLPGIVALVRDSNGVWAGAAGQADITQNVGMSPCVVSKAASLTKTFVGTLALKLVEEGKFSLDDPLPKWISTEVLDNVKNVRESTVRQLLNHTTGIADVISDNSFYLSVLNDPARHWKPDELIKFVYGDEPLFAPGKGISYSNTNFLLLAMVIEKATGQDHSKLLREKILEPLQLHDTYYYWHDNLPTDVAQGYFDLYNNKTIINVTNYNTGSGNGYGGVYSTVFDLQAFLEALVRERRILTPAMMDQMLTFTDEEEDTNRGNGLGIVKDYLDHGTDFSYGHRGRDLGYTADMNWFPNKDRTLVYLINYGTDGNSSLRQTFYDFRLEMADTVLGRR
jgi:D-alanyl-D-alanine carboxypeptidase